MGVTRRHQFLHAYVDSLVKIILGGQYLAVSDGRRGYLYKCRACNLQVIFCQGLLGLGKQYLGFLFLVLLFLFPGSFFADAGFFLCQPGLLYYYLFAGLFFSEDVVFAILAPLLLLMTLAFSWGFVKEIKSLESEEVSPAT